MSCGSVYIYSGEGQGKSSAALGRAVLAASEGKSVLAIRFLKGKELAHSAFFDRLEPEIKIFSFEKSDVNFDELTGEKKSEEIFNIKNGLHFAKKVLATGECDLLILDEILGLIDNRIITPEDLKELLAARDEETDIILTGIYLDDEICALADGISRIENIK